MKYFVVRIDKKDMIFVFPRSISHDRMHEAVCGVRHGEGNNWSRKYAEAISAGFIDGGKCWGRSETMDLDSRGELDTALLRGSI